ncbi:hypothetical protein DFH06DRAFT_1136899 [Mycena polygramma]|nr:hypothetical protein DFH06DRAFT_1136899 [Mycena polygramma]
MPSFNCGDPGSWRSEPVLRTGFLMTVRNREKVGSVGNVLCGKKNEGQSDIDNVGGGLHSRVGQGLKTEKRELEDSAKVRVTMDTDQGSREARKRKAGTAVWQGRRCGKKGKHGEQTLVVQERTKTDHIDGAQRKGGRLWVAGPMLHTSTATISKLTDPTVARTWDGDAYVRPSGRWTDHFAVDEGDRNSKAWVRMRMRHSTPIDAQQNVDEFEAQGRR